jgi:hypothetical protein
LRLPPELFPAIIEAAWLDPHIEHARFFRTVSLVCRNWQRAVRAVAWQEVFCLSANDLCVYLALRLDLYGSNRLRPPFDPPTPIPLPNHIRTKSRYLNKSAPFGKLRSKSGHPLLNDLQTRATRLLGHDGLHLFPDARILTVTDARDFKMEHRDEANVYAWVRHAPSLVELRLFCVVGAERAEEVVDPEPDDYKLVHQGIKRLTIGSPSITILPWATVPNLCALYPNATTIELRAPRSLINFKQDLPEKCDTLILKCLPNPLLAGRSSVLDWMLTRSLGKGLMAPPEKGSVAVKRTILLRTGEAEPLGWGPAVLAAKKNGVVLKREVVF